MACLLVGKAGTCTGCFRWLWVIASTNFSSISWSWKSVLEGCSALKKYCQVWLLFFNQAVFLPKMSWKIIKNQNHFGSWTFLHASNIWIKSFWKLKETVVIISRDLLVSSGQRLLYGNFNDCFFCSCVCDGAWLFFSLFFFLNMIQPYFGSFSLSLLPCEFAECFSTEVWMLQGSVQIGSAMNFHLI